ncbi:hypothetical protein KY290_025951 [Solanum tuberosum]|uniref:Uncharacterized protein n=1 Tax=Solanum tuberosum TaxID=4113 RepID=A0ABQ7UV15_SOLTU|nr:hypothetical protein KY289_025024 [Solanum tuberosum]KAH0673701.1 hypothetical protein KY284_024788 [Solanum tuberosum]KAH0677014.1 hypothetical protein KY285_024815 [Solanum tuberosum]KAH0722472.1 hypothetical protein KY289_005516 [Solanum tuberosum]KAH0755681.1 hypothetical protein KY290_025951 [Solanum tuberosum]
MDDICFSNANHIDSFYARMRRFVSPIGTDDWYGYMASRTSNQIQWKYPLLSRSPAYIRCMRFYHIELFGLKGLQPYAPVHVLQPFDQTLKSLNPERFFMNGTIFSRYIGDGPEREIPEYQVWLREDCNSMSLEGEKGFEDIGTMIWIRHSHLGTKVVTPEMWAQMETIMQYLDNVGAGLSNVGASFSLPPPT